jgi:nucleotide-binding universal stress UspA family protein
MLEGSPHDALLSLARKEKATLVVVSSKGHGDSPLYRVGGTSERIARDATLPVLVVRDPAPFQAWARGARALRVVVGVNFSASAAAAIRWTKTLAQAGPCDVVFAHVYHESDALERYGLRSEPESRGTAELERLLERDVTTLAGAFVGLGSQTVRICAAPGRAADTLLEVAREERSDLVVVGTHHRRGPARLWSVSSAVLHLAPMAVAIAPTPAAGLGPEMVDRVRCVLVATDLTPESSAAIPFAHSLVARGGTVHVLHVLPPREHSAESVLHDEAVAERLRQLVPPGVAVRGIGTKVEVVQGDVASEICDLAERLGAEIVCVTSRHRGLARAMGSVVTELLREIRKPLLVLHPPAP